MPTRNINLTDELDNAIRARVSSGRYDNASEVVRDALRALDERDQRHVAELEALREGFEAGRADYERGLGIPGTTAEHMAAISELVQQRLGR